MICPKCHKEISDDALYCQYCGTPLGKKICPSCRAENDMDALFCAHCGRPFERDMSDRVERTAKYDHYVPIESDIPKQNTDVFSSLDRDQVAFEKVDKKVHWKSVLSGVLALLVVTGGSYYYLRHSQALKVTNRPAVNGEMANGATFKAAKTTAMENYSNLANNGTLASDGKNVFLTNDNGYLVKTDINFKNATVLVKEAVQYINVYKKSLYFTDANHYLCMTTSDGGAKITIIKKAVYYLTLHGDHLYYQLDGDNESLYDYNIKTKKSTRLVDLHVYNMSFNGNDLYYNAKDGIYVYHLDSQKNELILKTSNSFVQYYKGYVYYINNASLMRVNVSTKTPETIVSSTTQNVMNQVINVGTYVMNDQAIYFYNVSQYSGGSIYRVDLKTKQVKTIYDGLTLTSTDIQLINDNLVVKSNKKWIGINTSNKKAAAIFSQE